MSNILSGGFGPNYEAQSLDEKAIRVDASGVSPQWPSTPKTVMDALPSDAVTTVTANLSAFGELLTQLEAYSVGKAGEVYARTVKAAADSGDPSLAASDLNQVKDQLRAQRRELNLRFNQQYEVPHLTACIRIGEAAMKAYEDL